MVAGIIGLGGLGHLRCNMRVLGCTSLQFPPVQTSKKKQPDLVLRRGIVSSDSSAMAAAESSLDMILNTASGVHGAHYNGLIYAV